MVLVDNNGAIAFGWLLSGVMKALSERRNSFTYPSSHEWYEFFIAITDITAVASSS